MILKKKIKLIFSILFWVFIIPFAYCEERGLPNEIQPLLAYMVEDYEPANLIFDSTNVRGSGIIGTDYLYKQDGDAIRVFYTEEYRNIVLDRRELTWNDQNMAIQWAPEHHIAEKAADFKHLYSQQMPYKVGAVQIRQVTLSWGPSWDVNIKRLFKNKYRYEEDGIQLIFTPSGTVKYVHAYFCSDDPPETQVDISRERALAIAKLLSEISVKKMFPKKDVPLKFVSEELVVKKTEFIFKPFTMALLSDDIREARFVWQVVYTPINPIPAGKNGLVYTIKDFAFYLDPRTGEPIGWTYVA